MSGNGYKAPQRFTQHKVKPEHIREAIDTLKGTGALAMTPAAIVLIQQTKYLCDFEDTPHTGKNARCMEIANKVKKVVEDNPAMVEVWWEWCKREDVRMDSQSAIECFNRLYQAALQ